jgi:hypothetical protein
MRGVLDTIQIESTVFRVPSREGKYYNAREYNCYGAKCYSVTLSEETGLRAVEKGC